MTGGYVEAVEVKRLYYKKSSQSKTIVAVQSDQDIPAMLSEYPLTWPGSGRKRKQLSWPSIGRVKLTVSYVVCFPLFMTITADSFEKQFWCCVFQLDSRLPSKYTN